NHPALGGGPINVGNAGSVQGILGTVNIGTVSFVTVNVDDSADPIGRVASIGASAVTGLAPAAMNYPAAVTLTVNGGSGADTVTVTNTSPGAFGSSSSTTLNAGGGNAIINVQATDSNGKGPPTVH